MSSELMGEIAVTLIVIIALVAYKYWPVKSDK